MSARCSRAEISGVMCDQLTEGCDACPDCVCHGCYAHLGEECRCPPRRKRAAASTGPCALGCWDPSPCEPCDAQDLQREEATDD